MVAKAGNRGIQQLQNPRIHQWYRFVLSYPDHVVTSLLKQFKITPQQTILDPFVGTGTTLVECKKNSINSIGIDANPFTVFASRVKTTWDIDLTEFERRQFDLLKLAKSLSRDALEGEYQLSFDELFLLHTPDAEFLQQELNVSEEEITHLIDLLPKNWINPQLLRKVIILKKLIDSYPDDAISDLFRLALIAVTVSDVSNISFGPEVYVSRSRTDANLYAALMSKFEQIKSDLMDIQKLQPSAAAEVYYGDARRCSELVNAPIDFVISSPPYPNEKDYTRITRLELILLSYMQNKFDLRQIKEGMLRSHTRNLFASDQDSQKVDDIPEIQSLDREIEQRRLERGANSGFERLYHRVVTEYFGGMLRVFEQIDKVLVPGGKIALVVGDQMSYFRVPIHTSELLGIIASRKLGYAISDISVFRTRRATASNMDIEEHILILSKL